MINTNKRNIVQSRMMFENEVYGLRSEATRYGSEEIMLKKFFGLTPQESKIFKLLDDDVNTFKDFRKLFLITLASEKIPLISLKELRVNLLDRFEIDSSINDEERLRIVWAYLVLNIPKLGVLIVGPTDFNSVKKQQYIFRVTLQKDMKYKQKNPLLNKNVYVPIIIFAAFLCANYLLHTLN